MIKRLLVATHNQGKVIELAQMLSDLKLTWFGLDDLGVDTEVGETGSTFLENARLKARAYAEITGMLTLADDSGLEVDALNGRPGVHTARYGGRQLTHVQRYQLLLSKMEGVPWEKRNARFRSMMALSSPDGSILGTSEGTCEGIITIKPMGKGGFGYDPIFYLPDEGVTMAQLDPGIKNRVSHRGRALRAIEPCIRKAIGLSWTCD